MDVNRGIREYLFEKNIYVFNEYFKGNKKDSTGIIEHLNIISEVQKVFMNFNTGSYSGVKSYIGKDINRIRITLIILKSIGFSEDFMPLIKKLEMIDCKIREIDFKKIARRSVDRKEITIGRLDERNIRVLDEIEIGKIKKVAYNVIEEDVISYMKRIKRDYSKEDIEKFILSYIKVSGLDRESYKYIRTMIEVPNLSVSYIEKNRSKLDRKILLNLMERENII
ncbi:MAG: hypothetical protein ACRDDY_14415 [Clostridium sp.]|uniref:hypothetical protein n=1 Tax=Clostridium sp. TaxID=1506 RepID=UPI003EE633B9